LINSDLAPHNKLAPSEFILVGVAWDEKLRTLPRAIYRINTKDTSNVVAEH